MRQIEREQKQDAIEKREQEREALFAQWILECTELTPGSIISSSELWGSYKAYRPENKHFRRHPWSYRIQTRTERIRRATGIFYEGIKLK